MPDSKAIWAHLLTVPRAFLHGLIGGLAAPILALAGAVGLLYLFTHKLPAIAEVTRASGGRENTLVLAAQTQARASWVRYAGKLRGAMLEARARRKTK